MCRANSGGIRQHILTPLSKRDEMVDLDEQLTVAYMMNKMELGASSNSRGIAIAMAAAVAAAN